MPGGLIKRSVRLSGHRTSVALEAEFWDALDALADARGVTLAALITEVDAERLSGGRLASALRILALQSRR